MQKSDAAQLSPDLILEDIPLIWKEGIYMRKRILWITRTGVLLAVLIALQAITKPLGQLVTGSCVNAVLTLSVTLCGIGCGAVVALVSPLLAFLLGIAPNVVTVPAIMLGNLTFVLILSVADWRKSGLTVPRIIMWLIASAAKFGVLYLTVSKVICGLLSDQLLTAGILKVPMLNALPATFGIPQLITALIGGAVGIVLFIPLRKAIRPVRQ